MDKPKLIDIPQVAEELGLSIASLYRMIARGEFPRPIKVGKRSLYKPETIDQWIDEKQAEAEAA